MERQVRLQVRIWVIRARTKGVIRYNYEYIFSIFSIPVIYFSMDPKQGDY